MIGTVICIECGICGHRAVLDQNLIEMIKPKAREPYRFVCERGCRGPVWRRTMTVRDARRWRRER